MKSLPRILPIFLLASLVASPKGLVAKSSGRIAGTIMSKGGEGLLGAAIAIFERGTREKAVSRTRSDVRGVYSIANLAPGSYRLKVSRKGYQPITRSNVTVDVGRTTNLNIVLQDFMGFIVGQNDPRNWDLGTVVRAASRRRLIFRNMPGSNGDQGSLLERETRVRRRRTFAQVGTMNVTSSAGLSSDGYSVFPTNGRNGIVSNFAFAEPVGDHGRMIFSGQLNSGYDSLWRVRNTYQYSPEPGRDLKFSLGYGRLNLNGPSMASVGRPTQFFSRDPALRESGVQTIVVGFEARSQILDPIVMEYGFDLSRVYYGAVKSVFSPLFRLLVTPADTWTFKAEMASRRVSDNNSVLLPDGETVNLAEPIYIAQINGDIYLSQFKHLELAVSKDLPDYKTSLEVAVYEDLMAGPGTPFLLSSTTQLGDELQLVQLREDQAGHHGVRFAAKRRLLDSLACSFGYVYGTGTEFSKTYQPLARNVMAHELLAHMQRTYFHSFTGRVDATILRTMTHFTTIVRWYPRNALTPIDPFYDRKDTLGKGVNFFIRQTIPVPEFMGTPGRWEALLDLRNLLDQGKAVIPTSDGVLFLTRNPRTVRFGINLNLF